MADPTSTTYRAIAVTVRVGLKAVLGIDLDVQGASRVPKGPHVLAHNQVSVLDAFVVSLALAEAGDHTPIIMLREDVRSIPVLGRLLSSGAVFAEDVELPREFEDDAFTAATQHLFSGSTIVVAPEHHVSPSLELMPLRSGAARLATATDVPLVPAATFGAHRLFTPDRKFRPRRGLPVSVTFGNEVPLDGLFDYLPAMRRLQFDLEALISQVLVDYPDAEEGGQGAWWWPSARGGSAPSLFDTLEDQGPEPPAVELWATNATVAASRRRHGVIEPDSPTGAADAVQDEDEVGPRIWSLDDPPPEPPPPPPDQPPTTPVEEAPIVSRGGGSSVATSTPRSARGPGLFVTDVIAIAAFDLPGQPRQVLRGATMSVHGRTLTTRDEVTAIRMRVRDLHREGGRSVFWGIVEDDHIVGPIGQGILVPSGTGLMLAATRKVT